MKKKLPCFRQVQDVYNVFSSPYHKEI